MAISISEKKKRRNSKKINKLTVRLIKKLDERTSQIENKK